MRNINFFFIAVVALIRLISPASIAAQDFKPDQIIRINLKKTDLFPEPEKSLKEDHPVFTSAPSYDVDKTVAKRAAMTFLKTTLANSRHRDLTDLDLVYSSTDVQTRKNFNKQSAEETYYYIFSSEAATCYVIISADSRARPVLAYSFTSSFRPDNIPRNLLNWLSNYEKQISYAKKYFPGTDEETRLKWMELNNDVMVKSLAVVEPLLKTTWAQQPYYNDFCPFIQSLGERSVAGCTAVAMAQIMKYWSYPEKGKGTHSYTPESFPEIGKIHHNFGETEYNWDAMPNSIEASNNEIATLIYHCGISINMDYGIENSWGPINQYNHPSALQALIEHFSYKQKCQFQKKKNYTSDNWLNKIITELNAHRPILYSGGEEELVKGGHTFVCDGYDNNYYLHFNFGWGGLADGYFCTDAINFLDIFDFTEGQVALFNIEPSDQNPEADMRACSKIKITPSNHLTYTQPFSIYTEFRNFGLLNFKGSFLATFWNSNNQLVGYINNPVQYELPPGESTGELVFSSQGIVSMEPGSYFLVFLGVLNGDSSIIVNNSFNDSVVNNCTMSLVITGEDGMPPPDEYENNDQENIPSIIIPEFSGDNVSLKLKANIHQPEDTDIFKILLPGGMNYRISSLLTDFQTNTSFCFDGKYSLKIGEESNWSNPEDIDIPDFSIYPEDSCVYFKVEPFFPCYLGQYELTIDIAREKNNTTGLNRFTEDKIKLYPMPNNGSFTLELGENNQGINEIFISDLMGKIIIKKQVFNPGSISDKFVLDLQPGIYLIHITNKNNHKAKRLLICK